MSRVTAPSRQISRALNSAAGGAARTGNHILDHNAGAVLMPKYAELLRNRRSDSDATRGMKTAHRPTPQPSIANRSKPLMQSFHSSPASSAMPVGHLDAFFLPSLDSLTASSSSAQTPSMPTLPDNFASRKEATAEAPAVTPAVTIIAANPDNVASNSALSEINGLDTVWLNFAQQNQGAAAEDHSHKGGMVKDMWKGL